MTRTTPELAPPLQTFAPHQRDDVRPLRMILLATGPIHDTSSVESGFEPGTLPPPSRDLTTKPSRPFYKPSETNLKTKKYLQRKHPTVLQCPPGRLFIRPMVNESPFVANCNDDDPLIK
ncbi:hypothetical protein AVEN_28291-1 [Araneus ventricosus]|uniref:Uncharacterized protein n=1 Tax=Araneus ventricosus TaxID=182803 RepID=A0A4Y2LU90_ARAVE|nr:hypothetical protein AVEN_259075-1 [Araneus ventricosus]GBN17557.1 hypothetical protein AVEN_207536-1 [Araneus ventricosus]GBN17613.1 hypothetical protein AVEN_28291-1 [Araneus ventricosus]